MQISPKQQHCLQGIGVRLWSERQASDEIWLEAEPEPALPEVTATLEVKAPVAPVAPVPHLPADDTSIGEQQPTPVAKTPRVSIEIPTLDNWDDITGAIRDCEACELSQNCTQKVPGVGDRQADLLIVGEGPGHDEDIRGEPFVGRSGQLLDRMLAAIGIDRQQVYITNIVKCRPPNNRDPKVDEAQQCRHYLEAQIRQIAPRVILAVGRVSAHNLLGSNLPVGKLIKEMHQLPGTDIPIKVTYHPAYLLRNPSAKAIAWQDLKLLHRLLQ
ncbi:MAG: uracil-DNA glycosylase [Gammaproteobacteria bacterium]|nr:uracil-DNA glycosylase [Gammaproteobacteria bacterium]